MKTFIFILSLVPAILWAQHPLKKDGVLYKSVDDASVLQLFENKDFCYSYDAGDKDEKMQILNAALFEGYWEMKGDTLFLNLDLGISRGEKLKFTFARYLKSVSTLELIYYSERFDPQKKVEKFELQDQN